MSSPPIKTNLVPAMNTWVVRSLNMETQEHLVHLSRPNRDCCGHAFSQRDSCDKLRLVVAVGTHCEQKLAVIHRGSLGHVHAIGRDSLGSDLEVYFPSGTRNKIFDPGIFFEVKSKRFLSRDTFSISFIRNPVCIVIETLLPFSSENEDKVFNPGILSSNLLSHRGKITSNFSESPMMISEGDIPFLDVLFLHFYPS
ncbi:hypothetical protein Tco_1004645 [Tanacetum coccineum]|uniref:Uncharacterized protein n=1 Tax=Tanacetum coccineum TaxID=301880 RepID=A0ABQ5FCZ0_9ASTR